MFLGVRGISGAFLPFATGAATGVIVYVVAAEGGDETTTEGTVEEGCSGFWFSERVERSMGERLREGEDSPEECFLSELSRRGD